MAYTRTAIFTNRTTREQFREMQNSLREISSRVGWARRILSTGGSPAPETYLSAIRAIRAIHEAWSLHLEIERVLFPRMHCRNLLPGELNQIMERDRAIEMQLASILSAPWPRSPHSGLQSLRSADAKILTQLLAQIERERALILSGNGEHIDSEDSELVAI
jgi:hypothetical protein